MDYDRTMKLFAQEIQKTNRKIQMYVNPPNTRLLRPTTNIDNPPYLQQNRTSLTAAASRVQKVRHSLPNNKLTQQQVCCITVSPGRQKEEVRLFDPLLRHKTQESSESLASRKLSRVKSTADENPELTPKKRPSLADTGLSNRLPVINYEKTYYDSLSRQVELSKLRKQKHELTSRMQDIDYVNRSLEQFPFGGEHIKIMEKVMNKREIADRRNQQTLMKFEQEQQQYKRQKNIAAKLLRDSRVQRPATNNLGTTLQSEIRMEYNYASRQNTQSIVEEVSQTQTINQDQHQQTTPLEESILTVKLQPNTSVLTTQQKPTVNQQSRMSNHQKLPLVEQQVIMDATHYPKINYNRKPQKVHYTLMPKKQEKSSTIESKKSQPAEQKDDMANIRKHLELLKKRRLDKLARQKREERSIEQPLAEINQMLEGLHAQVVQSRSFNHPVTKREISSREEPQN